MRFLHLRLMLVDMDLQSGSPSLVMRTFWNCLYSSSDCGIVSAQLSGFSVPKCLGTSDGFYHHSFANSRLKLLSSCYVLLEGSRGLFC